MAARKPEDCDRLFQERMNAGDVDGLAALYEPGASLVPPGGSVATGHAAIRQALASFIAMRPRIELKVDRVLPAGDGLAVVYSEWTMSMTGPDGQPNAMAGKAIEVVRRQSDGTWLFVADDPTARS